MNIKKELIDLLSKATQNVINEAEKEKSMSQIIGMNIHVSLFKGVRITANKLCPELDTTMWSDIVNDKVFKIMGAKSVAGSLTL